MLLRRTPNGALMALAYIAALHLVTSYVLVPRPVAGDTLRHKVMALTATHRPRVVIAGDSRAERQIIPAVIARKLEIPEADVVNIARPACESSGVLAAYRESSDRFAGAPIMLISVSLFSVNDRENEDMYLNDEVLWSLSLAERFRVVGPQRALLAAFLPERALFRGLRDVFSPSEDTYSERGFRGFPGEPPRDRVERWEEAWRRLRDADVDINGLRWRQLQRDLQGLKAAGVQLVLLDSPDWPRFSRIVAGSPRGEARARFSAKLAGLCRELDVPLLSYDAGCFGAWDLDRLFRDPIHLNREGAGLLSEIVGGDLRSLAASGRLRVPEAR